MTDIVVGIIKFMNSIMAFLLPDTLFMTDIFTNFGNYLNTFTDFLIKVNFLIPLPTIFSCLAMMVTIKVTKFTIFIFNWLVRAVLDVIP